MGTISVLWKCIKSLKLTSWYSRGHVNVDVVSRGCRYWKKEWKCSIMIFSQKKVNFISKGLFSEETQRIFFLNEGKHEMFNKEMNQGENSEWEGRPKRKTSVKITRLLFFSKLRLMARSGPKKRIDHNLSTG